MYSSCNREAPPTSNGFCLLRSGDSGDESGSATSLPAKRSLSTDTRRRYCPHCSQNLSYSAFWSHKAKFYNSETDTWVKFVKNDGMNHHGVLEPAAGSSSDPITVTVNDIQECDLSVKAVSTHRRRYQ